MAEEECGCLSDSSEAGLFQGLIRSQELVCPPFGSSTFTGGLGSLQHELFEVVMQDGVLDVSEHQPDVFRVDGRGEVVVEGLLCGIASLGPEAVHHERLDIRQAVVWPRVFRKVVLERNALHLLLQ